MNATKNHLPLEHLQFCNSRFSKVNLNACHNVHHDKILPKQFLNVILTRSVRRHGLPNKKFIDDNHNNIPIITYNLFSSPTENNATTKHHPYFDRLKCEYEVKNNGRARS